MDEKKLVKLKTYAVAGRNIITTGIHKNLFAVWQKRPHTASGTFEYQVFRRIVFYRIYDLFFTEEHWDLHMGSEVGQHFPQAKDAFSNITSDLISGLI